MTERGYDSMSEMFDDPRIATLASALGMDEGNVALAVLQGLDDSYPDSSRDDIYAYASAIRDLIDEGWVTPENLDSLFDEGNDSGVDSNGNELGDEGEYGDDYDDDWEDDDDDEYDDDWEDDDEDWDDDEKDEDDIDSDERIKDRKGKKPKSSEKLKSSKKPKKECVSDETVKNIVDALSSHRY